MNVREREVDDWSELFRLVDEWYKFMGVWKLENSYMWFIEVEWIG